MSLHQLLQMIEQHPVRPSDGGAFEQEGNVLGNVLGKGFEKSFGEKSFEESS